MVAALLTVGTVESFDPPGVIGYVEDTGPGIAQEVMDKIFQPYFTTKPKGQGIGLGLTFVRSIIEAHHGHIRVLPSGDRGTRFEFFLPTPPVSAAASQYSECKANRRRALGHINLSVTFYVIETGYCIQKKPPR